MWCTVMILNLHLHTVWNNNFLMDKYIILNVICWGAAAAIMGVCVGLHAIKFEFANLCLLEVDLIMKAFFYPMAAIVLPGFIAHFATFIYIARVCIDFFFLLVFYDNNAANLVFIYYIFTTEFH